jgi:hypothetical protein
VGHSSAANIRRDLHLPLNSTLHFRYRTRASTASAMGSLQLRRTFCGSKGVCLLNGNHCRSWLQRLGVLRLDENGLDLCYRLDASASHSLKAFNYLLSWSAYDTFLKRMVVVHHERCSTSRSIPSCNNSLGGCCHGRLSGEQLPISHQRYARDDSNLGKLHFSKPLPR